MMQTSVLLIRHGQTSWNATGRWQGWAPVPLNETGRAQARALADYLKRQHELAAVYCSDLPRALQTAETIAQAQQLQPIADSRLRGPHIGAWQGLTGEEILAWDRATWERYRQDSQHNPRPGGESRQQVATRAMQVLQEARTAHQGQTFAVITHSGALWAILSYLNIRVPEGTQMDNTSVTQLSYKSDNWCLVSIAQIPHQ